MTGLNLETFLRLLRADLGLWATLGLIGLVLGLMTWTSWGSRKALRKCLVLSISAHLGLLLYGSTLPVVRQAFQPNDRDHPARDRIRRIRVSPWFESSRAPTHRWPAGQRGHRAALWDRPHDDLTLADPKLVPPRPSPPRTELVRRTEPTTFPSSAVEADAPGAHSPEPPRPESRELASTAGEPSAPPPPVAPSDPGEIAEVVAAGRNGTEPQAPTLERTRERLRPDRVDPVEPRPEGGRLRLPLAALSNVPAPTSPTAVPVVEARPELSTALPPTPTDLVPVTPAEVMGKEVSASATSSRPALTGPGFADVDLRDRSHRPEPEGRTIPRGAPGGPIGSRPPITSTPALTGTGGPFEGLSSTALSDRPPETVTPDHAPVGTAHSRPAVSETAPEIVKRAEAPPLRTTLPESDTRRRSRPDRSAVGLVTPRPMANAPGPVTLARVAPSGLPHLPEIQGAAGGRPLNDVPEVYRSRLDPNRSALAQRAGASPASEQAVERALDWLARHQDLDGRWDGATARFDDGTVVKGDDSFTSHCPPGEICFGESYYWEADTALSGLALLCYLGSGYTQAEGKYAETVGRGLGFLLAAQKPDGDLRGKSRAVGLYCHAMATLAICEAYALTGDERLRDPVERAVAFMIKSRARDGLAWRYAPQASMGDTSILGWVVLALKSAKDVGVPVSSATQTGMLGWLGKVSSGQERGLARYQPWDPVTPTMTAEAWVCRQFLGVGGPGPASTEAADYLLTHGPDSDPYNLYYWYYGTLAMYQHGGDAWDRWNVRVRDQVIRHQRVKGHPAGSWDPDDSLYGSKGGRIYCTTLATLTLEVYYRFLRLYDDPKLPPILDSRPARGAGSVRR